MSRVLALRKKVNLTALITEWADFDAYVRLNPLLSKDMAKLAKSRKGGNGEQKDVDSEQLAAEMIETIQSKFVDGKVVVEKEDGTMELVSMEKEDIAGLPFLVISTIFGELVGKDHDPKAGTPTPTQASETSEEKPTNAEDTTETS